MIYLLISDPVTTDMSTSAQSVESSTTYMDESNTTIVPPSIRATQNSGPVLELMLEDARDESHTTIVPPSIRATQNSGPLLELTLEDARDESHTTIVPPSTVTDTQNSGPVLELTLEDARDESHTTIAPPSMRATQNSGPVLELTLEDARDESHTTIAPPSMRATQNSGPVLELTLEDARDESHTTIVPPSTVTDTQNSGPVLELTLEDARDESHTTIAPPSMRATQNSGPVLELTLEDARDESHTTIAPPSTVTETHNSGTGTGVMLEDAANVTIQYVNNIGSTSETSTDTTEALSGGTIPDQSPPQPPTTAAGMQEIITSQDDVFITSTTQAVMVETATEAPEIWETEPDETLPMETASQRYTSDHNSNPDQPPVTSNPPEVQPKPTTCTIDGCYSPEEAPYAEYIGGVAIIFLTLAVCTVIVIDYKSLKASVLFLRGSLKHGWKRCVGRKTNVRRKISPSMSSDTAISLRGITGSPSTMVEEFIWIKWLALVFQLHILLITSYINEASFSSLFPYPQHSVCISVINVLK